MQRFAAIEDVKDICEDGKRQYVVFEGKVG